MGRAREHNKDYWQVRNSAERCELCGCSRGLEVHHIVPIALGGPDEKDNMLVVCNRCHTMLTPRPILIKMGIQKARTKNEIGAFAIDFLKRVDEQIDTYLCASDVIDIFNKTLMDYVK